MSGLTIMVESSLTLKTKHEHYIKEARRIEVDVEEFRASLGLAPDSDVTVDGIKEAFHGAADVIVEVLWDAIVEQLDKLED